MICKSFFIKSVKNIVSWNYVINNVNGEGIVGTFSEKELEKVNQAEFKIDKVIKKKCNNLYIKWKRYDNSFNSWIDKNEVII